MAGGIMREVDRAIGALSTIVLGVGILVLRELFRDRDGGGKWEKYAGDDAGKDIYFQKKYGMPKLPLFQHRGGCDCGALRFLVLAPKRVEAFDDSNTFSCKKGRFPFLIVPTSCFEMLESAEVSLYDSQATSCQHVFCSKCGIHIFQFDHTQPDCVAVNIYCIEDENFDDMKIIFIPKGSKPLFGRANRAAFAIDQALRRPLQPRSFASMQEDEEEEASTVSFQKQLMMWARADDRRNHQAAVPDDSQSSTSSTSTSQNRFSFASSEDPLPVSKDQLEYYLKRHLDDSNQFEV